MRTGWIRGQYVWMLLARLFGYFGEFFFNFVYLTVVVAVRVDQTKSGWHFNVGILIMSYETLIRPD